MTNTIPNVPRQLLERAATSIEQRMCIQCEGVPCCMPESLNTLSDIRALLSAQSSANHVEDVRAMVADPSPAGVDGLEVETFLHTLHMELGQTEQLCSKWNGDPFGVAGVDYSNTYSVTSEPLCRLSDAQAIIDGLRGENERIRLNIAEYNEAISCYQSERNQQAQRIGELEAALEFACKSLAQVTSSDGSGHADIAVSVLRMAGRKEADASQIVESYKAGAKLRIDAALSAGKEGE